MSGAHAICLSKLLRRRMPRAIDDRVTARSREEAREKAKKAFARLANCVARSPAELRRRLDRMAKTVLSRGTCDAEDLQRLGMAASMPRGFRTRITSVPTASSALVLPNEMHRPVP